MDPGCDYLTVGTLAETLPDLTGPIMTAADAQRRLRAAGADVCRPVCVCVIDSPDFALCLCKTSPSTLILILVSGLVTPNTSI